MGARSRKAAARDRLLAATGAVTVEEAALRTLASVHAKVTERGALDDDEAMALVEAETKKMRQEKRGRVTIEQG
ncbi:hypothetical protein [Nocardia niigatensis]|uniref:hypothetical protein n=1 Tax=Nocardia niigatensis TaxID=209249 RepID=UPI0002DAEE50|nr:hypothetical protein [Nocardia niigatensis]